jgi:hypothetical protein
VGRIARGKRTLSHYELNSEVVEPQSRSGREGGEKYTVKAENETSEENYCLAVYNAKFFIY